MACMTPDFDSDVRMSKRLILVGCEKKQKAFLQALATKPVLYTISNETLNYVSTVEQTEHIFEYATSVLIGGLR